MDSQLLKLKHDKLLSNVAFNCSLRHYYKAKMMAISAFSAAGKSAGKAQGMIHIRVIWSECP